MAAKKRTISQTQQDAILITDLFVKNTPLREITIKVNERSREQGFGYEISLEQVFYDVKKILAEWKKDRHEMIDNMVEIELAKLDKIETECWVAFEGSKNGKLKTRIEGGIVLPDGSISKGNVIDRTIETSVGDVRFLDRIQACIEKRIEILGLSKPKKIQLSNDPDNPLTLSDAERKARIAELRKELFEDE